MSTIDLDYLRTWIGKSRSDEDLISDRHARLMAATVDYSAPEKITDGECLPPLWHWTFFWRGPPARELGPMGTRHGAGSCRRSPLPNRMWAGGRVTFLAPILIGSTVRKESSILNVDRQSGSLRRSGVRDRVPRAEVTAGRSADPGRAGHRLQGFHAARTAPAGAPAVEPPPGSPGDTRRRPPRCSAIRR